MRGAEEAGRPPSAPGRTPSAFPQAAGGPPHAALKHRLLARSPPFPSPSPVLPEAIRLLADAAG